MLDADWSTGALELREYAHTEEGFIRSIIDRFANDGEQIDNAVKLARMDRHLFQ